MKKVNGILYALGSSAAFGLMPIFAKIAYNGGANPFTVVILRFFFAWLILFSYLFIKKVDLKIEKNQLLNLLLIGLVGNAGTAITLFMSYNYISVGLATTIHFIYPTAVTLICVLFYKESLGLSKIFSLILSISGVFLLINNGNVKPNFIGVFLAFLSGILYSYYIVGVAHSNIKNINCYVMTFYLSIISSFSLLIIGLFTRQLNFKISQYSYAAILCIAIFSTVIAIVAFQKSIKIIGSSSAAILSTFEPIVSMLLSILVLKEKVTLTIILGSSLIICSVLILTLSQKNAHANSSLRE